MTDEKYIGMASVAIHAARFLTPGNAHVMPIFATPAFTFDSAEQGMGWFSGNDPGLFIRVLEILLQRHV